MNAALETLKTAAGDLVREVPALRDFAEWPEAAPPRPCEPLAIPGIALLQAMSARTSTRTAPVVRAVKAAAPHAHWQQTYTEAEVGRDFLNRYGWFEIVGPGGHFGSHATRAYLAWWGAGLHYPVHLHEAEELYYILAGAAEFHTEGQPSAVIGPEGKTLEIQIRTHASPTRWIPMTNLCWRWSCGGGRGWPAHQGWARHEDHPNPRLQDRASLCRRHLCLGRGQRDLDGARLGRGHRH